MPIIIKFGIFGSGQKKIVDTYSFVVDWRSTKEIILVDVMFDWN
jgi:hypothetical protein